MVAGRQAGARLSEAEEETLRTLAEGPLALAALAEQRRSGALARRQIESLEARGLARRAAFTPTDALHVLGRYVRWDAEAARLGAELLAAQAGVSVEAFCEQVVAGVAHMAATEVIRKALEDEVGRSAWHQEPGTRAFLRLAMDGADGGELGCALTLKRPLVAIGAPVAAYMPEAARRLNTELVIPPHAEVANAVGAVSGSVVVRQRVLINPLADEELLRAHLPDGPQDFEKLEDAVAHTLQVVPELLEAQARGCGRRTGGGAFDPPGSLGADAWRWAGCDLSGHGVAVLGGRAAAGDASVATDSALAFVHTDGAGNEAYPVCV